MKDFKKLHKFLENVLHRAFGAGSFAPYPGLKYIAPSQYEDECIVIDTAFEVRLINDKWHLSVVVPVPGVRYHNDGSGTPDDADVLELGGFDTDTELVRKIAETLLAENLSNAIADEGIADLMEEEEVWTKSRIAKETAKAEGLSVVEMKVSATEPTDLRGVPCDHPDRNMNGGCDDCGDPCF